MARQFHRPARLDPEVAEQLPGAGDTAVSSELAHQSAQVLVGGFPYASQAPLSRQAVLAAVNEHGVETVAELWADAPAQTLPGTLWRLYLVREWIRRDPELVQRRYATTVDLRQADAETLLRFERAILADDGGRIPQAPTPEQVRGEIDKLLGGNAGAAEQWAQVLELVAAFLLALAKGSHPQWIEDSADVLADRVTLRDSALAQTAAELRQAASRARLGTLD